MLSKKSKIEQRSKSRERRLWPDAASANPCRTRTKLGGRPLFIRRGPSQRHARPAPAALKNSVHPQEKPFSTLSVRQRQDERADLFALRSGRLRRGRSAWRHFRGSRHIARTQN